MSEVVEPVNQENELVSEPEKVTESSGSPAPNPLLEKALKEKRNAMERVRELEAKQQEMIDTQLKEKEDFKSLYEASQAKLGELTTNLESERKEKVEELIFLFL